MQKQSIEDLFDLRSHNPSFFAVKASTNYTGKLLDFCIPVNLHFPPPELYRAVRERLPEILRYYPDYMDVHQRHLSEIIDLPPETIVPVNGSTEIITRLCQQAAGPLLTSIPTFSRWTDLPTELNIPMHTICRKRERQFHLTVTEIVQRVREVNARTLVISNPNNPTGAWLTFAEVQTLVGALPDLDALIIDESFIDFADLPEVTSVASLVGQFQNLVVVKSLGKSLGWHGLRLGYAVANPHRAQLLRDQMPFWNINGLAAFVLKSVNSYRQEYRASFARVASDRNYMLEQLQHLPAVTVYPSQANFLYVELPTAVSGRELRNRLLQNHGIMVRECSNKIGAGENYLRLAVQTRDVVDLLTIALTDELATNASAGRRLSENARREWAVRPL